MMLSTQPDMAGSALLHDIEPAAGNPQHREVQSFTIGEDGRFSMRTILMEPQNMLSEKLEAPVRVPPEWVPWFKVGMEMEIEIDATGRKYPARVVRIQTITDENGSSTQIIAAMQARPDDLQPGMVGTATLVRMP